MALESSNGGPTLSAPTPQSARITSLDTLRGVALLGILIMNIQAFAMPRAAYGNPTAFGDLSGPNLWVWLLSHILAEQKFISIFSMLFGAGIVLMASRAEDGGRPAALHRRRMGWLILLGLLHAHLLWFGDILYSYGLCGLLAYLFRRQSPARLVVTAVGFLAVSSALLLLLGSSLQDAPPAALTELERDWKPPAPAIAGEIAAYRGGWLDQLPVRSTDAFNLQTQGFLFFTLWKVLGLMLLGMALFKLGVFSAARSTGFYLGLIALGVLVGVPVIAYGVGQNFASGWDVRYSPFFGSQPNYWASILVALAWVGVVMLACKAHRLAPATRALAAVGRMALSNYILQTLVCTTIFYGHGLGLFGQIDRLGQIGIVVAVWALELALSPLWLRHFPFGPLEWLWRSLTYWSLQPMTTRQ